MSTAKFIGVPIGQAALAPRQDKRPPSIFAINSSVGEIIADFGARLSEVQWQIQGTVRSNEILSQIVLSNEAILISSDKIAVAGEVTFLDWIRDVNGQVTGEVDPGITRIRGGVIQTGQIMSLDALSYIDLDAQNSQTFIKSRDSVAINADGTFVFGNPDTGKALMWDGNELSVMQNAKLNGVPVSTVVNQAQNALSSSAMQTGAVKILSQTNGTDGNVYKFDTNSVLGAVLIGHRDIVFGASGVPAVPYTPINGVYRSAIGITSGGITMGYNRPSDGKWISSVNIDSLGNASFTGTVTAGSVLDGTATVGGVSLSSISANASLGATRPVGDMTAAILASSATAITMTSSQLFKSSSGAGGVFIGSGGLVGRDANGNVTFEINGTSGAASFAGNITGGSNINISGTAIFQGYTSSSYSGNSYSGTLLALTQSAGNAVVGVTTSGIGVFGVSSSNSSGIGVYGSGATGVFGTANNVNGVGVVASHYSTSGISLECTQRFRWGSSTWATPTSGQSRFLCENGTWTAPGATSLTQAQVITALGYTPIQQGGGSGQLTNKLYIGWNGSNLLLQVDASNFGSSWPISISGNANYASSAGSASSASSASTASNADRLGGYTVNDITTAISQSCAQRNGSAFTLTIPGVGSWGGCTIS